MILTRHSEGRPADCTCVTFLIGVSYAWRSYDGGWLGRSRFAGSALNPPVGGSNPAGGTGDLRGRTILTGSVLRWVYHRQAPTNAIALIIIASAVPALRAARKL
jgi:hypothetical protein